MILLFPSSIIFLDIYLEQNVSKFVFLFFHSMRIIVKSYYFTSADEQKLYCYLWIFFLDVYLVYTNIFRSMKRWIYSTLTFRTVYKLRIETLRTVYDSRYSWQGQSDKRVTMYSRKFNFEDRDYARLFSQPTQNSVIACIRVSQTYPHVFNGLGRHGSVSSFSSGSCFLNNASSKWKDDVPSGAEIVGEGGRKELN